MAKPSGNVKANVKSGEIGAGKANKFSDWKPGDSITKLTTEGKYPLWDIIRERYCMDRG